MSKETQSYRQIMKATSIFGGVQVFQIIIGVIRSKFIAVLLGPTGMGIAGLFQATTGTIETLTNFGISNSAVKNISAAYGEGDNVKFGRIVGVLRNLLWLTGLLGLFITLAFAPYWSKITFGNSNYTWAFIFLSVILLLNQLNVGQQVLLIAMRQIKQLAKSSLLGGSISLCLTLPLYYFFGIEAVVPGLIIASLITFLINWYFASKLKFEKVKVSFKDIKQDGRDMLIMGFMISLSTIISMVYAYFLRIYIAKLGSLEDVGFYNAGLAIVNTYVVMVFAAMATDYYPKLSAIVNDVEKTNEAVNKQTEIIVLILSPVILLFILFIKWVIILLYSSDFLAINHMVLFAIIAMLFKAFSWAIGYLMLAKSAKKIYFWSELIKHSYEFGFSLIGYYYYGLTGLGIAFLISFILSAVQLYIISNWYFKYKLSKELIKLFSINIILIAICLLVVFSLSAFQMYLVGIVILAFACFYNLKQLNDRMGLLTLIKERF